MEDWKIGQPRAGMAAFAGFTPLCGLGSRQEHEDHEEVGGTVWLSGARDVLHVSSRARHEPCAVHGSWAMLAGSVLAAFQTK
jgi:hypothetical protein